MSLSHEDLLQIAQAVQLQLENSDGVSGGVRWLGIGGAAHTFSGLNISTDADVVPLSGGQHVYTSITAGRNYRVDSDVNVYLKSSVISAIYGANLTHDTDCYSTGQVDMSSWLEINLGAGSFTMESWCTVESTTATPNANRLMSFGVQGGSPQLTFELYPVAGVLTARIIATSDDGTSLFDTLALTLTGITPSTDQLHAVAVINRNGASSTVTMFINGSQLAQYSYVDDADTLTLNSATGRITLGGTLGYNAEWSGRINDVKLYKDLLTTAEVQARTNKGPVGTSSQLVQDAPTINALGFWLSFQDSASWATATNPETVSGYGSAVFSTLTGSPAIDLIPGGKSASTTNSARILAGVPEWIGLGANDVYLNMYSLVGASGNVRISEI